MLGILFLLLGLAAAAMSLWQSGLLAMMTDATAPPPDYAIAGLSFTAALIFFGLWYARRVNREEAKARVLFD